MTRSILALLPLMACLTPYAAAAQAAHDVVVMRRSVAPPNPRPTATPTPTPTPTPAPATYQPVVGEFGAWSSTCSSSASRTKVNSCLRQPGSQPVDPLEFCGIPASVTESGKAVYTGCTGAWSTSTTETACSPAGSKDVTVTAVCKTPSGTVDAGATSCDPTAKPATGTTPTACTPPVNLIKNGDFEGADNTAMSGFSTGGGTFVGAPGINGTKALHLRNGSGSSIVAQVTKGRAYSLTMNIGLEGSSFCSVPLQILVQDTATADTLYNGAGNLCEYPKPRQIDFTATSAVVAITIKSNVQDGNTPVNVIVDDVRLFPK